MDALKWKRGRHYGVVLRPLDLYLLEEQLELHPILAQKYEDFNLWFDMASGRTVGFKSDDTRNELQFTMKDDAATLPRITEMLIITKASPWCTIVHNDDGVTLANVCSALWKEYTDTPLTQVEFKELSPRDRDRCQRMALRREGGGYTSALAGMWGHANAVPYDRCRRIDVLHGKTLFDGLEKDDDFAKKKLGFAAPNVFKLKVAD